MGVNSIDGQNGGRLFSQIAAPAPATDSPNKDDAAREAEAVARQERETSEEQVRQSEAPQSATPQPRLSRTQLRVEEDTKRIVAQLFDEDDNLIKQVPPEELLALARRFKELQALIFDERA